MTTPADLESSVGAEVAAGSNFGNKEAITYTSFGTPAPNANPAHPDFTSEGKVLDNVTSAVVVTSKSVKMLYLQGQFASCSVNLFSTVAGSLQVQAMCDESERDISGNAVWRDASAPIAVAANQLSITTLTGLVRQRRLVFTPTGSGTINAWIISV